MLTWNVKQQKQTKIVVSVIQEQFGTLDPQSSCLVEMLLTGLLITLQEQKQPHINSTANILHTFTRH